MSNKVGVVSPNPSAVVIGLANQNTKVSDLQQKLNCTLKKQREKIEMNEIENVEKAREEIYKSLSDNKVIKFYAVALLEQIKWELIYQSFFKLQEKEREVKIK